MNNHADAGISQIPVMPSDELPQVPGEIEPSQSTNEGNADPNEGYLIREVRQQLIHIQMN